VAQAENPLRPTEFDIAIGTMLGIDAGAPTLPPIGRSQVPLDALETAVGRALRRAPCFVAFSGGRDSSAVLATAVSVARRDRLPMPVPVTLRFPDAPAANESDWQERVVRFLGIDDWERVRVPSGELDWVGPVASSLLRRHGVLYSPSTFFYGPLLEHVRGGSMLTGHGGDQVFGPWPWGASSTRVRGRSVRTGRRLMRLGYRAAPGPLRRGVVRHLPGPRFPWLRPHAEAKAAEAWRGDLSAKPRRWDDNARWQLRRRFLRASQRSLGLLAGDLDCLLIHPLLDLRFVAALGRGGGAGGFGDRTDVMRAVFGGLLPDGILTRRSKATYHDVLWRRPSHDFAARWTGEGIPDALVDPEALRAHWLRPRPRFMSAMLLQSAWLAAQR
jgi:Asparagine synthase